MYLLIKPALAFTFNLHCTRLCVIFKRWRLSRDWRRALYRFIRMHRTRRLVVLDDRLAMAQGPPWQWHGVVHTASLASDAPTAWRVGDPAISATSTPATYTRVGVYL
jgi:hypothetical protein